MIVFVVTFLLALLTIGALFGLTNAYPQVGGPLQVVFSGEHILFFILSAIFLIFVIVTCFIVVKGQLEKDREHHKESE